ncbi:MAG TPA: histidine kinase [Thermoanaerobaculia bacterium]
MKRIAAVTWPLIGALVMGFDALIRPAARVPFIVGWGMVGWLEWIVLAPLVVALAERFPWPRRHFFLVHAIAPFAVSALHSTIFFTLRRLAGYDDVWVARIATHLSLDVLVYSATVLATHVVVFLRNSWSREEERLALEKEIAQAELDMLRLQLPPDVIRRKLLSIEEAIDRDPLDAEKQVVQLSAFLRERLRVSAPAVARAEPDDVMPPRPLSPFSRALIVLGAAPAVVLLLQFFRFVQALAEGKPPSFDMSTFLLSWFTWPVTLLMVWLGSRVKRIAILVIAAAAAPPLWDLAFHTIRSGPEAARALLANTNRTVEFLVFFAISLGALAYDRYLTWRRHAVEVAELDSVLLRTRARLLRLQLNPHFLFNALNSIAALLDDERDAARRMSAQLRNFVDRVLATSDRQEVPLGEELDLLSAYFAIENVRFGDRLQLDLDVARGAEEALVPSFLLQPLVENALRHGLQPETGGRVSVSASFQDDALVLEVADNGRPRSGVVREGIGLSNTRARLRQMYGYSFVFDFGRGEGGFRAHLLIPFRSSLLTAVS